MPTAATRMCCLDCWPPCSHCAAGAAAYAAFVDRSRRDRPRENDMRLLAVGLAVLWGGQSVGYIATAPSAAMWRGWVEQVPLLVAVPMIGTALVRASAGRAG
ncbi:MAG: hypothetical protein U0S36_12050 [Candidatus Nanopelagicales bacterium]